MLAVDGDISLSENPSIHFSFVPDRPGTLEVKVKDSEDQAFTGSWPVVADADS